MTKVLKHERLLIEASVNNPITDVEIAKQWLIDVANGISATKINNSMLDGMSIDMNNQLSVIINTSDIDLYLTIKKSDATLDIYTFLKIDLDIIWGHLLVMYQDIIEWKFLDVKNGDDVISKGTKMFGLGNGVGPDRISSDTAVS